MILEFIISAETLFLSEVTCIGSDEDGTHLSGRPTHWVCTVNVQVSWCVCRYHICAVDPVRVHLRTGPF